MRASVSVHLAAYTHTHADTDTHAHTHMQRHTYARTSLFAPIVTGAMIYRRATMCVEVSTERNERTVVNDSAFEYRSASSKRAALFSSGWKAIRSSKYRLVRIIITSPALGAATPSAVAERAPLSSIRLDS